MTAGAVGRHDDRSSAGGAHLSGIDARALGEGMVLADALDGGKQFAHDAFGLVALGRKIEKYGPVLRGCQRRVGCIRWLRAVP